MNELCRNADRVVEELQKTDPVKASECRSHIERLQVDCRIRRVRHFSVLGHKFTNYYSTNYNIFANLF